MMPICFAELSKNIETSANDKYSRYAKSVLTIFVKNYISS